ncbi:MAG: peptidylprolyl isomerase [Lamprobacter sp.]|uniref:peptidylprolyl isomerase n=1 Tax=Lamprobacter sp. TaxID=3100796 RepID=UPI002B25A665|nr:peptidylprolyl isomerase [Lamprobacter sp.]MEA3638337.1 peptidylprolyl isomerase [Lamprobacter sp.]
MGFKISVMLKRASTALALLVLLTMFRAADSSEQSRVLIKSNKISVSITQEDIDLELQTLNQVQRTRTLASASAITNLINELYRRRVLADLAKHENLDQTDTVRLKLQRANDSVLSDAAIDFHRRGLIASMPDFNKQAREHYQADPERFLKPASVQVRHILFESKTPETVEAALNKAAKLQEELEAGHGFADAAKEHSDDPVSAREGGLLDPFSIGQMVPAFEQTAFALETPGEISEPVVTQYGVHLIQLVKKIPAHQKSFDEVKPGLISSLQQEWLKQSMQRWLDEVSGPDSATVDIEALESTLQQLTGENASPAQH